MKKVYIVIIDYGSWDSYGIKINKVFLNKEDAEKYVNELTIDYNYKKSLIPIDITMNEDFDGDYDKEYENYIVKWREFKQQHLDYQKFHEFNKCIIEEFEVN